MSRTVVILAGILRGLDDIGMTDHPEPNRRAGWLRTLALAGPDDLARLAEPVLGDYAFEWLRRPEQGLTMVRARIGNTGDRYNVGEATVTRCAVRLTIEGGRSVAGVGYVLGLDAERAERIARIDALLQVDTLHALLWRTLIEPLRERDAVRRREERARTEASRVRFFALQPESP